MKGGAKVHGYAVEGCTRIGHACQTILACRAYASVYPAAAGPAVRARRGPLARKLPRSV